MRVGITLPWPEKEGGMAAKNNEYSFARSKQHKFKTSTTVLCHLHYLDIFLWFKIFAFCSVIIINIEILGSSSTFTCSQYFPYLFHLLHGYKEVHAQVVRTIRNHGEKKIPEFFRFANSIFYWNSSALIICYCTKSHSKTYELKMSTIYYYS